MHPKLHLKWCLVAMVTQLPSDKSEKCGLRRQKYLVVGTIYGYEIWYRESYWVDV